MAETNVKEVVTSFFKSFETPEDCAAECLARESEFGEQISAYTERIAALCNDPRYVPVIAMAKIGVVISVCAHGEQTICGNFGSSIGVDKAIEEASGDRKEKDNRAEA